MSSGKRRTGRVASARVAVGSLVRDLPHLLPASPPTDIFGHAVALDHDRLALGHGNFWHRCPYQRTDSRTRVDGSGQSVTQPLLKVPISMRQAIIDGAIKSFSKLGLKKTTIVDIANGAGVTRGTVYFHFKDKAAIVEASADHLSAVLSRDA